MNVTNPTPRIIGPLSTNYFDMATLPPEPTGSTARLVYVDGATEPSFVILHLTNGPVRITREMWRSVQLLRTSGSRFI